MITLTPGTQDIVNRHIHVPVSASVTIIQGDANSSKITFCIQRYISGSDLSTKEIYVCYKRPDKTTGRTRCTNIQKNNKTVTFQWTVPPEAASIPGTLLYHIDFDTVLDGLCTYRLKTRDQAMTITESFQVLNDAIASDYVAERLFLQENPNRVYHNDLTGYGHTYRVTERTIEFNPDNKIVAIVRDNMSCLLQFRLKRFYDGVDRKDMTFCFPYVNANDDGDIACGCNISYTDSEIFVGWALDSKVTSMPGNVTFKIGVLGYLENGDLYVWYTDDAAFYVKNTIDVCTLLDEPDFSWYNSWAIEADNILKKSSDLYNQIKEYYDTINKNKEDFTDYVESAKQSAITAASLAEDFSSMTVSRSNMDSGHIFQRLTYYRKDGTKYMESLLVAQEDMEHDYGAAEITYFDDKNVETSSLTIPIVRDENGIITGGIGILNQLQLHGLL